MTRFLYCLTFLQFILGFRFDFFWLAQQSSEICRPSRSDNFPSTMSHLQTEDAQNSVISVKIPVPWPNDLEVWLYFVNAQFATKKNTLELTILVYLLAVLIAEMVTSIVHLPSDKLCTALKADILKPVQPTTP